MYPRDYGEIPHKLDKHYWEVLVRNLIWEFMKCPIRRQSIAHALGYEDVSAEWLVKRAQELDLTKGGSGYGPDTVYFNHERTVYLLVPRNTERGHV